MIAALLLSVASVVPPADIPTPPVVVEMPAVVVQAPGVSVRVGTCPAGSCPYPTAPVLQPVLPLPGSLVPIGKTYDGRTIYRRHYWTPIRDFLFGRHRIHYVPIQ